MCIFVVKLVKFFLFIFHICYCFYIPVNQNVRLRMFVLRADAVRLDCWLLQGWWKQKTHVLLPRSRRK